MSKKSKSRNDKRKVQSEYLKRVERLCGERVAEMVNYEINRMVKHHKILPSYVIKSHYRSLATGISKPSKYQTKVKVCRSK